MRPARVVVVALVALLLTGCALLEARPVPTTSESGTAGAAETSAPAPQAQTPESAFIAAFFAAQPQAADIPEQQWLDIGIAVCEAFDAGATAAQVVDSMQGDAVTADEAAALVVSAARHLCPEYAPPSG